MERCTHPLALDSEVVIFRPLQEGGRVLSVNKANVNLLVRALDENPSKCTTADDGRNVSVGDRGPRANDDGTRLFGGVVGLFGGWKSGSKIRSKVRGGRSTAVSSFCAGFGLNPGCDLESPMLDFASHLC